MPSGGAVGGTVGSPLADLEDREHSHSFDPDGSNGTETDSAGNHFHEWAHISDGLWEAGDGEDMIEWDNGLDGDGSGIFPIAVSDKGLDRFHTDERGTHSHDFNLGPRTTERKSTGLPYIQLLICVRD